MSKDELVTAFLEGQISRRTLIKRLVAAGVSTGAAVSYAQLLRPEHAGAASTLAADNHYPMVFMTITSTTRATVKSNGQIALKVTCSEELKFAFFRVFRANGVPIGSRSLTNFLTAPGTRAVIVPVQGSSLPNAGSVLLYVTLQGSDNENYPAIASARKSLT
jgi:uncharacterized protein YoaH (UPF0181 family)